MITAEKLVTVNHVRSAAQSTVELITQVAQAAADDISDLDNRKIERTEIDAIVNRIHAEIFGGEVVAALTTQDGEILTTQDGQAILAHRILA